MAILGRPNYLSMILTRTWFFGILFFILVSPLIIQKSIWMAGSVKTTGVMEFTGHDNLGSALGISTYPVVKFMADGREYHFNGNIDMPLKRHQAVEVRYRRNDPSNARINTFQCIWGDTVAYGLAPLLVFLVLLLSPYIIPWRSRVKIGSWPFIRLLPAGGTS